MRRLAFLVGTLGICLLALLYVLWRANMLKSVFDFLGTPGVTALLAIAVPVWIAVIAYLWRRGETSGGEVVLRLNGEVRNLERVTRSEAAMHRGRLPTAEGNIRALVKASFDPLRTSSTIQQFNLEVSGVELETEFPPTVVHKGDHWEGTFEIPQSLEVCGTTARLVAHVGAQQCPSPDLPIPFEKLGKVKP